MGGGGVEKISVNSARLWYFVIEALVNKYWKCNQRLNDITTFLPIIVSIQFSLVPLLSRVQLFATPWTAAHEASLSITNSQSLFKLMYIESVMPSNHLILCHPLLLLPSIFPSIRVFSNESVLGIRRPEYYLPYLIQAHAQNSGKNTCIHILPRAK